jgi:hypothetical protein
MRSVCSKGSRLVADHRRSKYRCRHRPPEIDLGKVYPALVHLALVEAVGPDPDFGSEEGYEYASGPKSDAAGVMRDQFQLGTMSLTAIMFRRPQQSMR